MLRARQDGVDGEHVARQGDPAPHRPRTRPDGPRPRRTSGALACAACDGLGRTHATQPSEHLSPVRRRLLAWWLMAVGW